jgi:hypothetical protein
MNVVLHNRLRHATLTSPVIEAVIRAGQGEALHCIKATLSPSEGAGVPQAEA